MSEKSKYNFKCLEAKCETKACHIRPKVIVTISDLGRWMSQGYIMNILPGITIHMPESETDSFYFETARKPLESDSEITACIFYNEQANACEIRYSRPISCQTFPLEYNGEKYFLSSKDCPGVGQGEVSKEALQEARKLAEQEFNERIESTAALPAIYSVMMNQILRQSAEAMQNLSEEDRKKMDEILAKSRTEVPGEDTPPTDQSEEDHEP
ncbi:MAG: YkgJ family cysteine cluster protein [Candidatus Thorarchaeota archaeon]